MSTPSIPKRPSKAPADDNSPAKSLPASAPLLPQVPRRPRGANSSDSSAPQSPVISTDTDEQPPVVPIRPERRRTTEEIINASPSDSSSLVREGTGSSIIDAYIDESIPIPEHEGGDNEEDDDGDKTPGNTENKVSMKVDEDEAVGEEYASSFDDDQETVSQDVEDEWDRREVVADERQIAEREVGQHETANETKETKETKETNETKEIKEVESGKRPIPDHIRKLDKTVAATPDVEVEHVEEAFQLPTKDIDEEVKEAEPVKTEAKEDVDDKKDIDDKKEVVDKEVVEKNEIVAKDEVVATEDVKEKEKPKESKKDEIITKIEGDIEEIEKQAPVETSTSESNQKHTPTDEKISPVVSTSDTTSEELTKDETSPNVDISTSNTTPAIPSRPKKPSIPSRPTKKPVPDTPIESSPKPKAPPPKPKKLSSKIAAFQEMLQQPQVPPRASSPPKSAERKLSADKLGFAQNLKGMMGMGIPMPGMAATPEMLRKLKGGEEEEKVDDGEVKQVVTAPKRARGPKKRLPKAIEEARAAEPQSNYTIVSDHLWNSSKKDVIAVAKIDGDNIVSMAALENDKVVPVDPGDAKNIGKIEGDGTISLEQVIKDDDKTLEKEIESDFLDDADEFEGQREATVGESVGVEEAITRQINFEHLEKKRAQQREHRSEVVNKIVDTADRDSESVADEENIQKADSTNVDGTHLVANNHGSDISNDAVTEKDHDSKPEVIEEQSESQAVRGSHPEQQKVTPKDIVGDASAVPSEISGETLDDAKQPSIESQQTPSIPRRPTQELPADDGEFTFKE